MIISNVGDSGNVYSFKMLRALRVLRPLRSVKRVPSMRRLVSIMLRSIPELANYLFLFFSIAFGSIVIQTFHGALYLRCRLTEAPVNGEWKIDPAQSDFICTKSDDSSLSNTFAHFAHLL